jgi:NAD(P)-dependent dehydrogenase (short-subunit alcohol dehydrogenase family)
MAAVTAARASAENALAGKVVVVTGSARGIGRAIAEACAAAGADVVVSSRSEAAVAETVNALAAAGLRSSGLACDVRSADDLEALASHTLEVWGAIDVWVNNAGVSAGYRPFDELEADEIAEIVEVNLTGTALGSAIALREFRERGGVLLNLAGRGYRGEATPHTALYAATKAAVASLTRSLAAENLDRPGVHVHALVPGMVPTDFYRDIKTSPRLEATRGNVELALEAFGVPLEAVGRETAAFLSGPAWRSTGTVVNLLRGPRATRGIALMAWYGMTGRMKRDH